MTRSPTLAPEGGCINLWQLPTKMEKSAPTNSSENKKKRENWHPLRLRVGPLFNLTLSFLLRELDVFCFKTGCILRAPGPLPPSGPECASFSHAAQPCHPCWWHTAPYLGIQIPLASCIQGGQVGRNLSVCFDSTQVWKKNGSTLLSLQIATFKQKRKTNTCRSSLVPFGSIELPSTWYGCPRKHDAKKNSDLPEQGWPIRPHEGKTGRSSWNFCGRIR